MKWREQGSKEKVREGYYPDLEACPFTSILLEMHNCSEDFLVASWNQTQCPKDLQSYRTKETTL